MVGGWVPYWRSKAGTTVVHNHLNLFDQISPFAYQVQKDGSIKDTFKPNHVQWQKLSVTCSKHMKLLIPTLSWHATRELHAVLSDKKKRDLHIKRIMNLISSNNLAGININYEQISPHDRNSFLTFLEDLSRKLHDTYKLLHLTLEARTSDTTTHIINQQRYTSQKNSRFKTLIARCCDQIIIMGYDEWSIPHNKRADYHKKKYYASQACNEWLEQVIKYTLTFIPPEKFVLGIQTYGTEFILNSTFRGITAKKENSTRFTRAQRIARLHNKKPQRTPCGELSFTYINKNGEKRYVVYYDAHTVKDKINLIKKYKLKGIYLFAVYGTEDKNIWPLLEQAKRSAIT